jgi:acyl carrier protein
MSEHKQALKQHLIAETGLAPSELADDTALFSSGLLDSLTVFDLVTFVETLSNHRVPPTAVTLENFDTIARILEFIATLH